MQLEFVSSIPSFSKIGGSTKINDNYYCKGKNMMCALECLKVKKQTFVENLHINESPEFSTLTQLPLTRIILKIQPYFSNETI